LMNIGPRMVVQSEKIKTISSVETPAIQRSVTGFQSAGTLEYGPAYTLYRALYDNKKYIRFGKRETPADGIKTALVRNNFKTLYRERVPRATKVEAARVDRNLPMGNLERDNEKTGRLGLFARDFLLLNRGQIEKFEGGHLIGHALWDRSDVGVERSDTGANVVGMSRTMNTEMYKPIEDRLFSLFGEDNVEINVEYPDDMNISLVDLIDRLGLTLDPPDFGCFGIRVPVKSWIPRRIIMPGARFIRPAEEPARLQPFENKITTSAGLITVLQSHGIWNWVDPGLQWKIGNL